MIDGEVWWLGVQIQQIGSSGQVQSTRLRQLTFVLLEDVGDVFAAESLKAQGIFDGAGDFFCAVDFAQGHDFGYMLVVVEASFLELTIVLLGLGREGHEAHEQSLFMRLAPLLEELADMVRIFKVLMPVVTADMFSNQFFLVMDAKAFGIDAHGKSGVGILGRH